MAKTIKIAIDGPAAAGKSTVAQTIAEQFNYTYIDTGAMYRSLTYQAIQEEVSFEDGGELAKLLKNMQLTFKRQGSEQRVILNGEDITVHIRNSNVTNHVSTVAKHKKVRELMVERQQHLSASGGVVMDGRDIGTHVLPTAEVKIFLVASVDERAIRRHKENLNNGFTSDLEQIKMDIEKRDLEDQNRTVAPLVKAKDAIEINTTNLTIDEVVAKITKIINEQINSPKK